MVRRLMPRSLFRVLRDLREVPADARWTLVRGVFGRGPRTGRVLQRITGFEHTPTILVLCYGNIYRSPFAHEWIAQASARAGIPITTISGGLHSRGGRPSPADAQQAALELGVSLADHRSATITDDDVRKADLIVVMDRRNEAILAARFPSASGKILLLGSLDPLSSPDGAAIPDPYGEGIDAVRACYQRIVRSAARLMQLVTDGEPLVNRVSAPHRLARRVILAPMLEPVWAHFAGSSAAIVMMHRFEDRELGVTGHSSDLLAAHLEYLRRHRYNIVSLDQFVTRLVCGEEAEPRTVVFTVDDGHADFARIGAPIFARFDVPATLFLTTGFVDGETWLWYDALAYLLGDAPQGEVSYEALGAATTFRWRTAAERYLRLQELMERFKSLPICEIRENLAALSVAVNRELPEKPVPRWGSLTWSEVNHWGARGMRFGAHSRQHPILANEDRASVQREIMDSWSRIREATPHSSKVFAFPNGTSIDFGERERQLLLASGLMAALRADGGHCTRAHARADRFALPRIPYSDDRDGMRQQFVGAERLKSLIRGSGA